MADRSTLPALATDAFVERTPIDWAALRARVDADTDGDPALVENLRTLAAIRDVAPSRPRHVGAPQWPAGARFVVVIASVEIVISLGALISGGIGGALLAVRWPQLVLALAFTSASGLLAVVRGREPGRLFLIATFLSSAAAFARSTLPASSSTWSTALAAFPVEAFTPACLWQFAIAFPRVRRFARFDVIARRVAAAVWMVGAALFAASVVDAYLEPAAFVAVFSRGHSGRLFWRFFGVSLVLAIAVIFVRARRAPLSERRRVSRFALALAAGN